VGLSIAGKSILALFISAPGGTLPMLRATAYVRVRDRTSRQVVFETEFRNKVALEGMVETIQRDLADLDIPTFEQQYGITAGRTAYSADRVGAQSGGRLAAAFRFYIAGLRSPRHRKAP
jgi:hypothetical protein